MTILGISGSLRAGSYNRALLAAAAAEVPAGVGFREWRGLETLPAFDEDCDRLSGAASVAALRRAIVEADAVLIATPEYNHSIPGADVLEAGLPVPSAGTAFTPEGRLRDPKLARDLRSIVGELAERRSSRAAA